jgi:5-methyltetrahydrofolate--homocysteine methyltransferase
MVSPAMFDRHIAPILEVQARHLDHAIYHVDGPEAVRHVPRVCAISEINALNWIPGEGNGPMRRWAELLKDIQDRGKPVQCGVAVEDIEPILEVASPRGLLLDVRCESQAQADEIVKNAEAWTVKYDKPFGEKAG